MSPRDDATEAQVRAARPDTSTWLAANAGSGKTRVLTDRVARLLLDGVEPQHILCLTYTKAAASEMQNRLFKRLGAWAMLDDAPLREALRDLGIDGAIEPKTLRNARRLFARAIETPGGLKIQTIHSFCSALLRRFPLEARVSPQFTEIEERAADLLRAEVVDRMVEGPGASCVAALAAHFEGEDLSALTREITSHAEAFAPPRDAPAIRTLFDLDESADAEALPRQVLTPETAIWLPKAIAVLRTESVTMQRLATSLAHLNLTHPGEADLDLLSTNLLRKEDGAAKHGSIPTKKAKESLGPLLALFQDLMDRTADALQTRYALVAADRTRALHGFATQFLARYAEEKAQRGWLDFDDLIARARQLLTDPAVAAWVLFRIDGGIDHILVDEAQDTSPAQWDVIRKLAAEFTSGEGARSDRQRTLFVVGDKKQSIYSFQGADPRAFDDMRAFFSDKMQAVSAPFQTRSLDYSFRSSQAILRLVDATFAEAADQGFDPGGEHIAFKADLPGRVDLWPVIARQETPEDHPWYDPLDRRLETHHTTLLATRIADQIKALLEPNSGVTIPVDGAAPGSFARRALRPGDFLILFQSRKLSSQNSLFEAVIRALKDRNLPVAGADRLRVGAELAVRDLTALLSFLSMPEDCLSLAAALRSPLFGWSEAELYAIAQGREKQPLWQVLRNRETPATDVLKDLRSQVDFLRPYDLLERILTRHAGRRRILARLGVEAEDGINALLGQALAYERTDVPSLTGFLAWMEGDDLVIKRQIDSASDQIRVMTVHGAKGLEAPVVILPDCGPQQSRAGNQIVKIGETPVWKSPAAEMPAAMAAAVNEAKEDARHERARLLYVALTRAEKWLIVAAAGDLKPNGESWYQTVEKACETLPMVEVEEHGLAFRRYQSPGWDTLPHLEPKQQTQNASPLPAFLRRKAPVPAKGIQTLSPSDLGGAKALPSADGLDEDAALSHGTLVHDLLDRLGKSASAHRSALIERLRENAEPGFDAALTEALSVLDNPAFAELFAPETLTEVALSAPFGHNRISGVADKLIVRDTTVEVVDFKTNRRVPLTAQEVPEGLLRQMGAYAHALRQIYPTHQIIPTLVWTRTAHRMPLPHDLVTTALRRTGHLDAVDVAP